MQQFFNVCLEFDHQLLRQKIERSIDGHRKGYVCVVDANVLTIAQKDLHFREVLNKSLTNTCDGSSIATLAGMIHKKPFRALNGPDLFAHYIKKPYRQLLLGCNKDVGTAIKDKLSEQSLGNSHIHVMPLPFSSVEEFAYQGIANAINELNPDIIWVSLGAPKQELFMARLLPFLKKGVMFGIGAAFNFYLGKIALPVVGIGGLKFIWVSRIFSEPSKQIRRVLPYLGILPKLYFHEWRKYRRDNYL
ncbi:WecB/TagA/CpsF family glycosyltransferase [Pedobacter faecalis]|uniref:WecB/TagA/CpsF family glycosyltransferase n=1 Tax=Pedobacter faecalis TaxID=3041495 RepID=UPI00254FA48C|nr:WecB/TagA/CpsF family glycosyltransferase [Pedobacter sp. ELA7]